MLKHKAIEDEKETKDFKKKAIQFKTTGISTIKPVKRGQASNPGKFLQSKRMDFNPESSTLQPDLVNEKSQKEQKIVDMVALKRGLKYHGANKNDLEQEQLEIKKEEERIEREKAVMNRTSKSYNKDKDDSKSKTTKKDDGQSEKKEEAEEEREGILKMVQVQNLPDDIEMIVGQMKTLDFSK